MRLVRDPSVIARVWELEYSRLARRIASVLPPETTALVEVGCGSGQLTVPLARLLPDAQFDVIDKFEGTYASNRDWLLANLESAGLVNRTRVRAGDARKLLLRQPPGSLDAVVASELLSELPTRTLLSFFESCRRALKEAGVTVHAFLSPVPRNAGQKLTTEADCDPRWTEHPPLEWFSPPPDLVRESLAQVGFQDVRIDVIRSRLGFVGPAVKVQLKSWGVRDTFYRKHEAALRSSGMELPDWVIVSASRPPRR